MFNVMENEKNELIVLPENIQDIAYERQYEDFLPREDFINRTKIFVTPFYFEMIYDRFKESNVTVDEFVADYEKKYCTAICETEVPVQVKYEVDDDDITLIGSYADDMYELTVWDLLNNASRGQAYYRNEYYKYAKLLVQLQKELLQLLQKEMRWQQKEIALIEILKESVSDMPT